MAELGSPAPDFSLSEPTTGRMVSRDDFSEAGALLVVFLSNHCPYVKHIAAGLADFERAYRGKGLAVVGINANDVDKHPDDSPEAMVREVERRGYGFPYLFDASQEVAKAYRAACTPDFFLYDRGRRLAYRGQFDASRPGSEIPVTGVDLRAAADAVLTGREPSAEQTPSVGCNIKWKPGNNPSWFG
jgi:thiol-disulfide isomerase/thioredoxin